MTLSPDQLFWLAAIGIGGGVIAILAALEYMSARSKARIKLEHARAKEETKRELAAYVAEGSISPDDAAKILNADSGGMATIKSKVQQCIEASADAASRFAERSAAEVRAECRKSAREGRETTV